MPNICKGQEITLPSKSIRAGVIRKYLEAMGTDRCICITCGNCARALRNEGLRVLEVGEKGLVVPTRWLTYLEFCGIKGKTFDATSGHLPVPLMLAISKEFRRFLGNLPNKGHYVVPSGSGETIVCLSLAYPNNKFTAVYGSSGPIQHNKEAPLNGLVKQLVSNIVVIDRTEVTEEVLTTELKAMDHQIIHISVPEQVRVVKV